MAPSTAVTHQRGGSSLVEIVEEVVSRGQVRVPPYPSTALRLQALLAEDYDIQQLVDVMRTDQVFTGNLLRLANSALYRRGNEVTSISAAVARIGSRELTRLAMASAMGQLATGIGLLRPLRRRAWRESFASALLCEVMAAGSGLDANEAFVAGLLHDAGKLLVLSAIEEVLQKHPSEALDEAHCSALVDKHHVALGGLLAERWKLPGVLGAVIVSHHDPAAQGAPLMQVVARTDAIVSLMETQAAVTAETLEPLQLATELVDALTHFIPKIPALINALDAASSDELQQSAARSSKPSPAAEARVEMVGGKVSWPLKRVDAHSVIIDTSAALQPHALMEIILQPQRLQFWALVESCEPNDKGFTVQLKPFSLGNEAAAQWAALVDAQ